MALLFVADLHLSEHRPRPLRAFLDLLAGAAREAEGLYILGDLFDLWLGDDDDTPPHPRVERALLELHRSGVPIHVMHGNHDFTLGGRFEARTGARLLPEPALVEVQGQPVVLMHGDSLCTDDVEYQRFRRDIRAPETLSRLLALPLEERRRQAQALRIESGRRSRLKPAEVMDVNQDAVEATLRRHAARYLVHGHTHRPGVHHFDLDGASATRIVLGDWYQQGSALTWGREGYALGGSAARPG